MRRLVSILLMAAMLFTVRVEAPRAQGPVPLEIEQFLLSMNIPPAQIPGLYLSAVTAMAGSTTLANFFSKVPVPGGFGLGTAASQSIRITVLEQLIGGWSGFQQAVLQNLQGLARVAAGTPDAAAKFASMVGDSGNWGNRFLSIYKNLRGAPAVGRFAASRGGFVPIQLLIITMTVVVAGTMGYVAGKVVLRQQDLQVKAAETQAYQSVVGNMAKGLQAGRVKLLPGLTPEVAMQKVLRNMDANLPPYADVFEVRPPPGIAGGWQGDLVVKDVAGQSAIQEGQSRRVSAEQFKIEQEGTEVTLTFGGNRIKGYFGPIDELETRIGNQRTLTIVDNAVLTEPVQGSLSRAALKFYSGAGAGGLAGKLEVEIEQRSNSATITSGGQLTR